MTAVAAVAQAKALLEARRFDRARDVVARHLAESPDDGEALCVLAQACLALDDNEQAAAAATAAAARIGYSDWPHRLASIALVRLGHVDDARRYADAAVRIAPGEWRVHANRAQIDIAAKAVGPASLAGAQEAVRLAPHEDEAHRVLGSVLMARKRYADAEQSFREALRLDPQSYVAHNELARARLARRDIGAAAAGFADAAALRPTDDIAARNLVVVSERVVRVAHLVLWIVVFVVTKFRGSDGEVSRTALGIGWLVATAVLGTVLLRLHHRLGGRTRRVLRIAAHLDRMLVAWALALVVSFVGLGLAAIVPAPADLGVLAVVAASLLAGVVLSWVRRGRARRR